MSTRKDICWRHSWGLIGSFLDPCPLPFEEFRGDDIVSAALVFYDCEASGLDGFPIEIGWAFVDETANAIVSESHLVRPLPEWLADDRWDPVAEELHGITLPRLRREGRPVWEIAMRMNQALAGRELVSDSAWDEGWVRQLFDGAGSEVDFTIRRIDADVLIRKLAIDRGMDPDAYEQAVLRASRLSPRQHRAEADARHLATLWNVVSTV